jgi:Rad3-related DNA helicase
MKHQSALVQIEPTRSSNWWQEHFPYSKKYQRPLSNQEKAFEILGEENGVVILEAPTASGKSLIAYVFLKEGQANGEGPMFYITPNKTLVQQIKELHPDVQVAYGRNEHECLYYGPENHFKADEVPCLLLKDCPHRVDQETGETVGEGAERCPYYDQKWEVKQGGKIVVATDSYYLFTHLFSKEHSLPGRLVIDEAHDIANVVRNSLSYEITDYHLYRAIEFFKEIGATEQAEQVGRFVRRMVAMIKHRMPRKQELLRDEDIVELIELIAAIDKKGLRERLTAAFQEGKIDKMEKREALNKIQNFAYDLDHYLVSLEYSRFTDKRKALNYTCAYWVEESEMPEGKHVQYKLIIKAYQVAGLIKRILPERTLAMSATIGDEDSFGFETGIRGRFEALTSDLPVKNTRVFLPTDLPSLAFNERPRGEPNKTFRRIIRTAKSLAEQGFRSLVILISNEEREKFLRFSQEEELNVISYGNGVVAKDAASRFREGEGDVLVGTAAHYSEGIDLPKGTAPFIFFLRPGYQSPNDPLGQFEERRYSMARVWGLRRWRAMNQALQVRGRNQRSRTDIGVCFFMDRRFAKFLEQSLPAELKRAYVNRKTFDECVAEARELLG